MEAFASLTIGIRCGGYPCPRPNATLPSHAKPNEAHLAPPRSWLPKVIPRAPMSQQDIQRTSECKSVRN